MYRLFLARRQVARKKLAKKQVLLFVAALAVVTVAAGVTFAEEAIPLSPKGIYHTVDEHQRTGIKFLVELNERGKKPKPVPVTHDFETDDRFTFQFEINRDTYIYIINQTLNDTVMISQEGMVSSGLKSKGIARVHGKKKPSPPPPSPPPAPVVVRSEYVGEPRLLFPTVQAGVSNQLKKDRTYPIPERGHYVMDDLVGTEKLYVVISDRRLNLDGFFHRDNGKVRSSRSASRLRRQLAEWQKNAEVELVTKGVGHEVASYGVSIDPEKPAMIEIDLQHHR